MPTISKGALKLEDGEKIVLFIEGIFEYACRKKIIMKVNKLKALNQILKEFQKIVVYNDDNSDEYFVTFKAISLKNKFFINVQFLKENNDFEKISAEINKFQSKFLRSISHELRTPLNGSIVLLTDSEEFMSSNTWASYIEPSLKSMKLLSFSVNDILDYASFFKNDFTPEFRSISIPMIINECQNLITVSNNTRKGLNIIVSISDDIPEIICNDQRRISQILVNLLTNAMKYTSKGKIIIEVGVESYSENLLYILVKDTGAGVPPERLESLFNLNMEEEGMLGLGLHISFQISKMLNTPCLGIEHRTYGIFTEFKFYITNFFQSNNSVTGEVNLREIDLTIPLGERLALSSINLITDLNLRVSKISQSNRNPSSQKNIQNISQNAISNEINDNDELKLESDKLYHANGMNNSDLVKSFSNRNMSRSLNSDNQNFHLSKLKSIFKYSKLKKCNCTDVLIVDDNDFNIYALKMSLTKYNLIISSVLNGKEAVDFVTDYLKNNSCCQICKLIFMDIDMPIMNGFKATKKIKEDLKFTNLSIPIIGCSAFTTEEDIKKCYEAGMDDFIPKPITTEQLELKMVQWFSV